MALRKHGSGQITGPDDKQDDVRPQQGAPETIQATAALQADPSRFQAGPWTPADEHGLEQESTEA
jgi:hypothetical protein